MKSVLNIIISVLVTAALLSSCSTDDKRQPIFEDFSEIDFGEGTYRPNPFKFLDDLPPFAWMGMPDSVKMKTLLEVKFNDDAVRSKSTSSFFFVDKAGVPISNISVNGLPAEDFIAKADTAPQWITISYCVNPAVGDSLLSGYLIADGSYLDESNGQQFSSGQVTIATWQLNHKIGINWLRWLIFIIVIALILYALFIIGYLIFCAISACIEALPAVSTISISIPSFSFKHSMKKQWRKKRKKADKKKKEKHWRIIVQERTGWSDEIIYYLRSPEEAEIYINAGLEEKIVNGRHTLVNPLIDGAAYNCRHEWLKNRLSNYEELKDYNNADLMGEGYPPRDENGDPFELHHIGQHQNSPYAELSWEQHMGRGNNMILHPQRESTIDRQKFEKEKADHWMARFKDFKDCYNKN